MRTDFVENGFFRELFLCNMVMEINTVIRELEEIHQRLLNNIPQRVRPLFNILDIENKRGVVVWGLRGVGKATFLL